MKRVIADLIAFGRQYMRSRVGAFFAFAFPVILILLFGAIFSGQGSVKVQLYVQDLDDTNTSHDFLAALNGTGVIVYHRIPTDVNVETYIRENSINTALRIPENFEFLLGRNETVNVTLYGDPTQSTYGVAASVVNSVGTAMTAGTSLIIMDHQTIGGEQFKFIDFFLPGMIGFTVLTNALFAMTPTAAEYRSRKYFKFLGTTSLTKGEWLLAKVLFYTLIMSVSAIIIIAVSVLVWGGNVRMTPTSVVLLFAFLAAGCFEFTSMGMALGMYTKDVETASAVANAIGFPMMFLGGTFFQIEAMPPIIQGLASAMPLTYLNEGLRATMIFGNEGKALLYLGVTFVLGLVFFLIASRALSWKSK